MYNMWVIWKWSSVNLTTLKLLLFEKRQPSTILNASIQLQDLFKTIWLKFFCCIMSAIINYFIPAMHDTLVNLPLWYAQWHGLYKMDFWFFFYIQLTYAISIFHWLFTAQDQKDAYIYPWFWEKKWAYKPLTNTDKNVCLFHGVGRSWI